MSDNPMATQGWTDAEEAVGWAIVQGLHSHVPMIQQPTGWADLNGEQLPMIKSAAQSVLKRIEEGLPK